MSTERERFEAWFTRDGDYEPEWLIRSRANQGMYLDSETEKLWEAWKAAIDAHLKEPGQEAAYHCPTCNGEIDHWLAGHLAKEPVQDERKALAAECKRLADAYRACPGGATSDRYHKLCAAINRLAAIPPPAVVPSDLLMAIEQILQDGQMNQEDLAHLRAAYDAATGDRIIDDRAWPFREPL